MTPSLLCWVAFFDGEFWAAEEEEGFCGSFFLPPMTPSPGLGFVLGSGAWGFGGCREEEGRASRSEAESVSSSECVASEGGWDGLLVLVVAGGCVDGSGEAGLGGFLPPITPRLLVAFVGWVGWGGGFAGSFVSSSVSSWSVEPDGFPPVSLDRLNRGGVSCRWDAG